MGDFLPLFTWDTSFCLAITEATAGSDVSAICTSAVRTPDGTAHIVNGVKKRVMSPYASGISIHRIHNTGHNASDSLWVELTDVKVPIENQIGPENGGSPLVLRNFNKERFILAVGCNRQADFEAHWAWLEQIAYHVKVKPEGWQTKHVAGPVALAKVQGAQVVERAVRESQQIHGGRGYEGGKTMTE
ncbi:hypothetical protein PG995_013799 [Apiospora arundinis]